MKKENNFSNFMYVNAPSNEINTKHGRMIIDTCVIPDGEVHKDLETMNLILDRALELGLDRKVTFIALGGGVIGDMVGFAASVYQRGVNFIQVCEFMYLLILGLSCFDLDNNILCFPVTPTQTFAYSFINQKASNHRHGHGRLFRRWKNRSEPQTRKKHDWRLSSTRMRIH